MPITDRPVRVHVVAAALCVGATLTGCGVQGGGQAAAVGSPQTCYRLPMGDATHAVVLSGGDGDLMTCAMHVEAWRLMKNQRSAMGLYQGHYVWASADGGITSAETLQAPRFHVYTPGQQADMDGKIRTLIQRKASAGDNVVGGT